jgi:hypothetical protein
MASISVNNGGSWSNPVSFGSFAKAASGVALAATANNEVMLGFAWSGYQTFGINAIRTFGCNVNAGQLQPLWLMWAGRQTRIQPALSFDQAHQLFVMAWRDQNFATTLATMTAAPAAQSWSGTVELLSFSSNVAPGLGSLPEYAESVLWYAYEGP